jgi:integrase/recombinase XerD
MTLELASAAAALPDPVGPGSTPDQVAAAWLAGHREPTRSAYRRDLKQWADWLNTISIHPFQARRVHVDTWTAQLEHQGRRPATIARKLAAVAGYYAYAVDEQATDHTPCLRARRPKTDQDDIPRLGLDTPELQALLQTAAASSRRDHALVTLLALNGPRISSILQATTADISHQRGHTTLTIRRKGGKRQTLPLAPRTVDALLAYTGPLNRYTTPEPLFATSTGQPLDRQAAWKIIRQLAKTAGINKPISPHSLRHTFVTQALDAGATLRDVQDAAGHADPKTTRRYDRGRHSLDRHPTYALAAQLPPLDAEAQNDDGPAETGPS